MHRTIVFGSIVGLVFFLPFGCGNETFNSAGEAGVDATAADAPPSSDGGDAGNVAPDGGNCEGIGNSCRFASDCCSNTCSDAAAGVCCRHSGATCGAPCTDCCNGYSTVDGGNTVCK